MARNQPEATRVSRTVRRSAAWRRPSPSWLGSLALLPVEALPELDAVDDARELLAVVVATVPEVGDRPELSDEGESEFGRLGHGQLAGEKPLVAGAGMDPEALGGFLGEETRLLAGGQPAQKEAGGEADGTRAWSDEVREVAEWPQVAAPAFTRENRGERRLLHDERTPRLLDALRVVQRRGVHPAAGAVAGQQHAGFLQELAHGGHPECERRRRVVTGETAGGGGDVEAVARAERGRRGIVGVDFPARKRIEAAEKPHRLLAANHVDLGRLGGVGRRVAHDDDRGRGLRLGDGSGDLCQRDSYRLMSCATRSRWYVASPKVNSDDLARLK